LSFLLKPLLIPTHIAEEFLSGYFVYNNLYKFHARIGKPKMRGIILALFLISITAVFADDLKIEVLYRPEICRPTSKKGQQLGMLYKGSLTNGKVFDSNSNRSNPFTFTVGAGQVIKGWDLGLLDMCVGEKRQLTIPPELGYGRRGAPPDIPPNATLIFDVELVKIG